MKEYRRLTRTEEFERMHILDMAQKPHVIRNRRIGRRLSVILFYLSFSLIAGWFMWTLLDRLEKDALESFCVACGGMWWAVLGR